MDFFNLVRTDDLIKPFLTSSYVKAIIICSENLENLVKREKM